MKLKALKAAFPYTLPILAGYSFLGMAFGIMMNAAGFSFVWPLVMSILIFGGSIEYVAVEMLTSAFSPVEVFIMTLLIQARHVFYGISMLDKFKGMGWKKPYLIFGMTDETFSINCSVKIPEDVDKGWFMFFVTLLDQIYWVTASAAGGIIGSLLKFDTSGISFVMTAMFVVILLEQWLKEKDHTATLIGLAASVVCLLCFGADSFMIPTMIAIVALLAMSKNKLTEMEAGEDDV